MNFSEYLSKISKLYFDKNFEGLFEVLKNKPQLMAYLCSIICEKRKLWAKELKKSFKASGDLKKIY